MTVRSRLGSLFLSSDIKYPHLVAKLTSSNLTGAAVVFSDHSGSTRYNFRMTASIPSDILFQVFIKPNNADKMHALLGSVLVSGNWEFDVICEGANTTAPDLYIFAEIHTTSLPIWDESSAGYGLKLIGANSETSLDTRFKPLSLEPGSVLVYPKILPTDGGFTIPRVDPGYTTSAAVIKARHTYNFDSNTTYNDFSRAAPYGDMFSFDSTPQAGIIQNFAHRHCDCGGWYEYLWQGDEVYEVIAKYGVYYRAGMRLTATGIRCGWIPIREDVSLTSSYSEEGTLFSSSGYSTTTVTTDLPMENDIAGYRAAYPMIATSTDFD